MSRKQWSRRLFLQAGAGTTGAMIAARSIALEPVKIPAALEGAPLDRVRFGIIGIGMQGSGLLATAVALPRTECVAACDLYDGRHTLAREIAGPKIKITRRLEAVIGLDWGSPKNRTAWRWWSLRRPGEFRSRPFRKSSWTLRWIGWNSCSPGAWSAAICGPRRL